MDLDSNNNHSVFKLSYHLVLVIKHTRKGYTMYKSEDLKFFNMKQVKYQHDKRPIFEIENQITIEEKIDFIDQVKDGIATYLINLVTKWVVDRGELPKDLSGHVKTNSLKAWIRRNDTLQIVDYKYKYGQYNLFGGKYNIENALVCPTTEYGRQRIYTGSHIVNQWYHDLCTELYFEEKKYFESIDSFSMKIIQVHEYSDKYGALNNKKVNDIKYYNSGYDNINEEELDIIIDIFEKIEVTVNEGIKELNSKIDG